MTRKAVSEEAGRQLAESVRAIFGADIKLEGLTLVLYNGQASPAPIASAPKPAATATEPGAMAASDKAKLDGIAEKANNYSLPTAGNGKLGGVKTTSSVTSATGYTPAPIVDGVPYYKDTNTTYSVATQSANGLLSSADKAKIDGFDTKINAKAPTASPTFTGTPKAPTPSADNNSTQIATTAYVQTAVTSAVAGAAAYKGAVTAEASITGSAYKAGWYWIVNKAGTYVGETCEVGDMVFANADKGSAYKASDFDVIQSNIDYVTAAEVRTWFA